MGLPLRNQATRKGNEKEIFTRIKAPSVLTVIIVLVNDNYYSNIVKLPLNSENRNIIY